MAGLRDFKIGERVWRAQGTPGLILGDGACSTYVVGPFKVYAIIRRAAGVTYLVSWHVDEKLVEGTDEQDPFRLFRTKAAAQRVADAEHNTFCEKQKR